ncbi:DEAD/DEAH box helicase [Lujinxingia vulgaris]|uniref:DEAD/DEAH box helicase n=1 Tax=Lujinxingia vulgaris TaxID=2600176 RepID=A0A5C6XFN8_9DELT|nr:DEAD/DEAH box helicase family protein [Lujinxingia vulgaris]TXD39273.1 DEAD/DEAH box helicase [Lujinxingia vulgaris]
MSSISEDSEEQSGAQVDAALSFEEGTLVLRGEAGAVGPGWVYDARVDAWRAPAWRYRQVLAALLRSGLTLRDEARVYAKHGLKMGGRRFKPYEHQSEALEAWSQGGRRGVVVLPTGAGKSYVASMAIEITGRTTLVVVPTIDLMTQWVGNLEAAFGQPIGMLGGGYHQVERITVSTYDSAAIHMARLGDRFGLMIFDEAHHLPGEVYRQAALQSIAPFRLGLTATPERSDGKERDLDDLVGPQVYRRSIKELAGEVLADYEVRTLEVAMNEEDRELYEKARAVYRGFVESQGIRLGGRHGWRNFLAATSRSDEGRRALKAHRLQKRLALVHQEKLALLFDLLDEHPDERVLIFTNDNASVYAISEALLCPAITHETKIKERREILKRVREGTYRVLVTSKVLNEGVDIPEASVAMILAGSGSVREHVQRLGRILRRGEGKRALLYELVTADSVEGFVSQRRREHDAYQ